MPAAENVIYFDTSSWIQLYYPSTRVRARSDRLGSSMKGCTAFGSAQLLDLSTNLTKSAICSAFWLFLTKTTDTPPAWAVSIHHLRAVSATFFQLTTHFWVLGSFWILATLRANFDRVHAAPKHINSFLYVFYSARRPSSLAIINSNANGGLSLK